MFSIETGNGVRFYLSFNPEIYQITHFHQKRNTELTDKRTHRSRWVRIFRISLKMHHGPPHEGLMKAVAHLDMEMAEDAATALARPPSKLNGESLVQDSHDRWCEARSDLRRGSLLFDGVSSSGGSTMAAMLSMGNDHFSTRGLEEDVQRKVASEQTVFLRAWLPEFREAHILKSTLEWLYRANGPGH
jgi:hypothetical protein